MTLQFTNYVKQYGNRIILSVPALPLSSDLYWLTGENGSGKTTLMKSIAGLMTYKGTISIDESDIRTHPLHHRKDVYYAEAEPLYPPFVTPKDLFHYVAAARSSSPTRQEYALHQFNILEYFNEPCGNLSSGMLKKVSLTLQLLGDPKILLLDEPLITLDTEGIAQLRDHLQHLSRTTNPLIIVSSHQPLPVEFPTYRRLTIANKQLQES